MDLRTFCCESRLAIVAGKGGVGKTTVAAALARMAAQAGLSALLVEIEGKHGLAAVFGADRLGYEERVLRAGDRDRGEADVRGRALTPDEALVDYLEEHGMRQLSRRLVRTGAVEVVSTAVPGIKVSEIEVAAMREVLQQMPAGSKWEVTLPADKYMAADPRSGFPPNVAVQFEIKLVSVK